MLKLGITNLLRNIRKTSKNSNSNPTAQQLLQPDSATVTVCAIRFAHLPHKPRQFHALQVKQMFYGRAIARKKEKICYQQQIFHPLQIGLLQLQQLS